LKALITGGAGVLGSNLAWLLLRKGYQVTVMDIVRREEAWRLSDLGILDGVRYEWKNVMDVTANDVKDYSLVIDSAIGYADRPMGISSPTSVAIGNLLPSLRLLESLRLADFKGYIIYPSSFNALYGHNPGTIFSESILPLSNNVYGWSKGAAEQLYHSYRKQYELRTLVTRVGSAFGPRGRSDELPHRLIIYGLMGRRFMLRSPYAKRAWTYAEDALGFYDKLIEHIEEVYDSGIHTLHLVGNKEDKVIENVELAKKVKNFIPQLEWVEGDYEPGEKDIDFSYDSTTTRKLLNWSPRFSVDEGLERTIEWFKANLYRYSV